MRAHSDDTPERRAHHPRLSAFEPDPRFPPFQTRQSLPRRQLGAALREGRLLQPHVADTATHHIPCHTHNPCHPLHASTRDSATAGRPEAHLRIQDDVLQLHVPMADAVLMQVRNADRNLRQNRDTPWGPGHCLRTRGGGGSPGRPPLPNRKTFPRAKK